MPIIEQISTLPFEFLLLRYRPQPWRMEDSILVLLNMFQTLTEHSEDDERMISIMEASLPQEIVAFLTPDTDVYTTVLLGGKRSHRPIQPIPVEALAKILRSPKPNGKVAKVKSLLSWGSNNWVVNQSKTADGRAIIANDMHLKLSIPNVWYRASLRYAGVEISGVTLPGVPGIVIGSNRHVAWGFTAINGDFLDLIRLKVNSENPGEYQTPEGWKPFDIVNEKIQVKGGEEIIYPIKLTIWGAVSERQLMGKPVAIHWTALDPTAVDIALLDIDTAVTLEDAMKVFNRWSGPPLNVVMADETGRVGWTLCG